MNDSAESLDEGGIPSVAVNCVDIRRNTGVSVVSPDAQPGSRIQK